MAKQGPIVVNEILCYIQGLRNTATVRQIHEAVISLFNGQKLHAALLLYHEHLWHMPHGIHSHLLYFPTFINNSIFLYFI